MDRAGAPRCAIIIPTFNGLHLLRPCLDSLLANPPTTCSWRIVVVDDGSSDSTLSHLQGLAGEVTAIELGENVGFARACNRGAEAASDCDYLVFLNNDTIPLAGWLDALVATAESDPLAAAVGAKLLFPNGTVQHAGITICGDGWPRHLYTGFPAEHPAVNRAKQVAAVTAACVLFRRADFEAAGGFDTAFHNGYEDVDLCLRLGEMGRRSLYCPRSCLYHLESVTRWRDGRESTEHNDRLYEQRWRDRVVPDDMEHYAADGLIELEYGSYFPLKLSVSPALATVSNSAEASVERLLTTRSRQVMELMADQTRRDIRELARREPVTRPATRQTEALVIAEGRARPIGERRPQHLVSLLMPVKNEGRSLRELLPLVLAQRYSTMLEIVAVDSGSEDDTIDVLEEYGATILSIPPAAFDHGLTRNLAAAHAKGDVLVFLNGRTRPIGDDWLGPLVRALDEDPTAAGACSRVIAHEDADLIAKKDGEQELSGNPSRERKAIDDWARYQRMSPGERRQLLNFHTVSAALRADAFATLPFRSVPTIGEDLLWAKEILEAGWAVVHEPASRAHHSHPYTLRDLFARNVDDGIANRDIVGRTLADEEVRPLVDALIESDWQYLDSQDGLSHEERERWKREAALRRVAQVAGQWLGANHRELPEGVAGSFSRVGRTRRGSGRD